MSETDLISRQSAIETLQRPQTIDVYDNYWVGRNKQYVLDLDALRNLPSTQPEIRYYGQFEIKDPILISERQWIPCSERLPEDYEDVLVWFEYFRYGDYNRLYQTYGIGDYSSKYDSWMINHESGWNKLKVLAWMPLPEPYKGEQE